MDKARIKGEHLLTDALIADGCPKDVHWIRDRRNRRIAYKRLVGERYYVAAVGYWYRNRKSVHRKLLRLVSNDEQVLKVFIAQVGNFRVLTLREINHLLRTAKYREDKNVRDREEMIHFGKRPNIPTNNRTLDDFEGGG